MQEIGKIGVRQWMILVILYMIGTTMLIIPSSLATETKQDAWLPALIGIVAGLLPVGLYSSIEHLYPRMTLMEMNEKVLGKGLGKAVSLLFAVWALIASSQVLYYVGDFMNTHIMPETPIQAFHIIFMLVVIMGVRLGLQTLARSAEFFFPWFIALYLGLLLFISPKIKLDNIQPVFETELKPVIRAALFFLSFTSLTLIVLLVLFPSYINKPGEARKAFFWGSLISGVMIMVIVATNILVLGSDLTARSVYPSYALIKKISVGNFLQRIEAVMAGLWFITLYYKIALYFYAAALGLAQTFSLKDYRPLTLPLGMIAIVLSLIVYPNVPYLKQWNTEFWLPLILTIGLIYPLILLGVGACRKKLSGKG
ncbi:GerAB/ArcD/ProY family transporter [Paenibacillus caui]|uniref:GerAB/ArcD/ProY family transporter n=1 Tax=Paenibacillus caui TaxID=2873927 RepID=UPI001CAA1548|nr:endospore germination permease [Paenibacillus caui]